MQIDTDDLEDYTTDLVEPILHSHQFRVIAVASPAGTCILTVVVADEKEKGRLIGREGKVIGAIHTLIRQAYSIKHLDLNVVVTQ